MNRRKIFIATVALFTAIVGSQPVFAADDAEVQAQLATVAPHCVGETVVPEVYVAPDVYENNILDVAEANGYTLYAQLVRFGGAQELITTQNGWTAFIPTNAAIEALPADVLERALTNSGYARQIILYHLIQDPYMASELPQGSVRTALGKNVNIAWQSIDGAAITQANIEAGNGIAHGVNKVLLPPEEVFTTRNLPPAPPQEPVVVISSEECQCIEATIAAGIDREAEAVQNSPSVSVDTVGGMSYTVQMGDSLSIIALEYYGESSKWVDIYEANQAQLPNHNALQIGMVLTLP